MSKNVRTNPETGEYDFYFPMEVTDDSALAYAKECKEQVADSHGRITFLDTPSDAQRQRYLSLIKDELSAQEAKKTGRPL